MGLMASSWRVVHEAIMRAEEREPRRAVWGIGGELGADIEGWVGGGGSTHLLHPTNVVDDRTGKLHPSTK